MSDSLQPYGLQPARLLCPWGFPGKNTGVGCQALLQGIFLTLGSNPCLLHWQVDSLPLVPHRKFSVSIIQSSSVAQSCPTLCNPMNRSTPGLPVHYQLPESLRLTSIESVMPSSHLILCRPFLLLPPIPPSIRVFSNESTLHMRWPKYWSFSFSTFLPKKSQG